MNAQTRYLFPRPEELLPSLPNALPEFVPVGPPAQIEPIPPWWWPYVRRLRCGCYLVKLTWNYNSLAVFDGSLRVECHDGGRTASGDLYQRPTTVLCQSSPGAYPQCWTALLPGPDPAAGIPILPRDRYWYYMRVTQILEGFTIANCFTLGVQLWAFYSNILSWIYVGNFTAVMSWTAAPAGYPSSDDYLEGDVKDSAGVVVGRLTMGWVSEYLRRAVVEIDSYYQCEWPFDNGSGVDWRWIFDQVGWDVTAFHSNSNVTEPSGESWSDAECHQTMLDWRDSADLDIQWRYHLLCVRRLDSTPRGLMYDSSGADSNNVPREGAAESSHWLFTNDPVFAENHSWGACANLRFGQCSAAYFRTAVHEIGHAMMLFHPAGTSGNHIMQVTPQVADNAVPPVQFPNNITWAFSAEDQRLLRHLPDVVVRPGTVLRFGIDVIPAYAGIPISPLDATAEIQGLEVQVSPLLEAVPLGAPVRVSFTLSNKGSRPAPVPRRLGLKTGHVTGKVLDPSGTARTFSTIIRYLDEAELQMLEPGQSLGDSLTLLRGPEGALFPSPGVHRVIVVLTWGIGGCPIRISGETSVMVTSAVDEEHARAALKVLVTPDALVTLVVGGDHLTDGIEAVQTAVRNPVLRPHFAYIEAKRLAQRFGKRKANLKAAAELITDRTVMSPAEIKKAAKLVRAEGADSVPGKSIAKVLKNKASTLDVSDEIKIMVDSL